MKHYVRFLFFFPDKPLIVFFRWLFSENLVQPSQHHKKRGGENGRKIFSTRACYVRGFFFVCMCASCYYFFRLLLFL
jgi:hypothetical protein